MAKVFIPYALRKFTQGVSEVTVPGETLGQVIDNLEASYSGIKNEIVQDGRIKPGLSAVCGYAPTRQGLMQPLTEDEEVHFVPAISGGSR